VDIRSGIIASAKQLGINPVDLATAISYETAGTFDPRKAGPTTKWGQHRGLIQFGEPQAQQYGVNWDDPISSQLGENGAVVKYLRDTGVKPGMGLLDVYSAINAGGVGRYNRSDTAAGGAPGTVRDKVEQQMAAHRRKAQSLLGGAGNDIVDGGAAADTLQQGGQPMAPRQDDIPPGLLGALGIQKRDPNAQGETAQPFYQRDRFTDKMGDLALIFNSLRMTPDQGLAQAIGQKQERRAGKKASNKTVEWLRQQGREDLAAAVEGGALSGRDAASSVFARPEATKGVSVGNSLVNPITGEVIYQGAAEPEKKTAGLQEYEAAVAQGYNGSFIDYKTALAAAGKSETNVTVGEGEGAFAKKTGELLAGEAADVVAQSTQAQRSLGQINTLEAALQRAPSGAAGSLMNIASNIGIKTEGSSDIELANSIISQLVPQQRPPGSGVMSDADLELFKQSLPRLINSREGNQMIVNTMRSIAEYDIARGQVARRLQMGEITPQQAAQEYNALGNPIPQELRQGGGVSMPTTSSGSAGVKRMKFNPETGQLEPSK
jgi:hypothetical protein